ncbi:hypothetical protein SOI71_05440 [Acinetobacter pittii]|uniref:hypothetical protein n=1 Tax=Acinetobacter pittii TaxID=48296 RepID=UPI000CE4E523|nr:hypothetical protein [Acinetobacter pittii]PPC02507.1 hypothetical protein ApiMCR53_05885 [Acinetobacter pittii]WPP78278.1 hypothetical protein SOI71_05440 [Acinetobacter pittii]
MTNKCIEVRDQRQDRSILFNPSELIAITFGWTGKKDYSQSIYLVELYFRSGHSIEIEANDDGRAKIETAFQNKGE